MRVQVGEEVGLRCNDPYRDVTQREKAVRNVTKAYLKGQSENFSRHVMRQADSPHLRDRRCRAG